MRSFGLENLFIALNMSRNIIASTTFILFLNDKKFSKLLVKNICADAIIISSKCGITTKRLTLDSKWSEWWTMNCSCAMRVQSVLVFIFITPLIPFASRVFEETLIRHKVLLSVLGTIYSSDSSYVAEMSSAHTFFQLQFI